MKQSNQAHHYLKMQTHHLPVPYYASKMRRVRVLLPRGYEAEKHATYPVVYMHDGQNIFYSKESFSGYSWKIIPTLKNHLALPKMIIVGIDNAGEKRIDEYGPWPATTDELTDIPMTVGGDGMAYGRWLVETVKPFIDGHYRTKSDRSHTLLAGSSMGGIITAYMGSAYPEVFGHLGVFSLASWISEAPFLAYTEKHLLDPATKVYIQVGTNEGDAADKPFIKGQMNQQYIDSTLAYYQTLLRTGHPLDQVKLRITADAIHHEKHWADHFVEFLYVSLKEN